MFGSWLVEVLNLLNMEAGIPLPTATTVGVAFASGIGAESTTSIGTVNATSIASGAGKSLSKSSGTVSATSSANGQVGSIGLVAGTSLANGQAGSVGIANGISTLNGHSASLFLGNGTANGTSSANGRAGSIGLVAGTSLANGQAGSVGIANGTSSASGQAYIGAVVGSATGISLANASGDSSVIFNISFFWQVETLVTFTKNFQWNTGQIPLTWYQVQGNCTTNLGGQTGNSCPQQLIQTIAAYGLADLCNQLSSSGLNWQLSSVKQWSIPAGGNYLAYGPDTLINVPISNIPECMTKSLVQSLLTTGVVTTTIVDSIFYYTGSGGAFTGGSATVILVGGGPDTSDFVYFPDGGNTQTGGSAITSCSWNSDLLTTINVTTTISNVEAVFGMGTAPALQLSLSSVSTACGSCVAMPQILYLFHNIPNGNILVNFLLRNGLQMPNPLTMYYSPRSLSWIGNFHLVGVGDDNTGNLENWRFSFEWACLNQFDGNDLGSYSWKFAMLAVRKNTVDSFDSRVIVVFPPDQICPATQNLSFNFSFSYNTVSGVISNSIGIPVNVMLLTDNIGLFDSLYWTQNPNLNINLSESNIPTTVQRQNIRPIFPQQPLILTS